MKIFFKFLTILIFLLSCPICLAHPHDKQNKINNEHAENQRDEYFEDEDANPKHSVIHKILLYFPNRVFDLLDIFRLKARIGPGFDVGIQITEPIRLYAGGHAAIYAGLPGPRQKRILPIPIGAESKSGGALSVLDGIVKNNTGSDRSYSEIAAELQLILVGLEIGIDPLEIADFFAGLITFEVVEDDL